MAKPARRHRLTTLAIWHKKEFADTVKQNVMDIFVNLVEKRVPEAALAEPQHGEEMAAQPNWDGEFDKLVEQLRKHFTTNNINLFLNAHLNLSRLFTGKCQYLIDKKDHTIQEYKFDVNPEVLKKIDDFNANFQHLAHKAVEEDKKLPEPEKAENK